MSGLKVENAKKCTLLVLLTPNILSIVFIPCNKAWIKGSGGKDTLFFTTDDEQKGHMGTSVKNIEITLLINTSSKLKKKVMRIK